MPEIYLFFIVIAGPVLLFAGVWAIVTVCRICFPERPIPVDTELLMSRWERDPVENPVGVQEIHDAHRRRERQRQLKAPLHYQPREPTSRIPDAWIEDLQMRRN